MVSIIAAVAFTFLCSTDAVQEPKALIRRVEKTKPSLKSELVSVEIGKHGDFSSKRQASSWWDATADCPEQLYGYDSNGRCRTDYYKPPNGVLDRFAKKECCEAYEKAKSAHEAAKAALASGTVHVFVKGARGLPDMDPSWGAGHSDAFVKIAIGAQKFTTGHVPHSASPDWNWVHDIKVGASSTDTELLAFEVWDHDSAWNFWWDGHDKISDLDVEFRTLPPNENVQFSEEMKTSKGKDAGVIKFEVKWVPDS